MDDEPYSDEDAEIGELNRKVAYIQDLTDRRSFLGSAYGEPTIPSVPVTLSWWPDDLDNPQVYHAFCGGP